MLGFLRRKPRELKIYVTWDEAAGVWVVTSSDVPGLVTEAESLDKLEDKLRVMVPELIELNGLPDGKDEVPVELLIHSEHRLALGC